jgi:hypothetical protein
MKICTVLLARRAAGGQNRERDRAPMRSRSRKPLTGSHTMRTVVRHIALAACLFATLPVHAAKFSYPSEDKEWFTVDIPQTWKPEVDSDGTLEATEPDDEAYLAFWTLESEEEIKTLDKDIEKWMKGDLKKIQMSDKSLDKEINGIKFTIFNGTAVAKEDNEALAFEIFLFSPKPGKLGVFYCQYGQKVPDAVKGLIKIVESIHLKG